MGVELENQYNEVENSVAADYSDEDLVSHVTHALLSVHSGDDESYHQLVGVLHHSKHLTPDDVALLVTTLKALSGATSYIDNKHHDSLLDAIFGMNLWHYGPEVMDILVDLIVNLASKHLLSCLDMLVSNFMPPMYLLDMLKQPRNQARKELVLSHLHFALERIFVQMPFAASRLSEKVVEKMPLSFIKKDLNKDHINYCTKMYVENMLRLESCAFGEIVGSKMLKAVVDMLMELDVAIGWDEILQDDSCKGIFAMELEDEEGACDGLEEIDDFELLPRTVSQKNLGKNVIAELLDNLMVQTFEHLELCLSNMRLNEVFEVLKESFKLSILNTYKSKFAQFVMFYACALDPDNCGMSFGKMLVDIFICGDNPLSRMSAVAYLASYLARANFLPESFIFDMLKWLVDWCYEYCEIQSGDMNPKAHRVFYSGCQAIMYVLCFRLGKMKVTNELKMKLSAILRHKFGALQVCLPSIAEEFLKQAKVTSLLIVPEQFRFEDLLESDFSRDFGGVERLDMFFPFDPCLLKKSDRNFIGPKFRYWKDVATPYHVDENDSSDEDIDDDMMEERMPRSFGAEDVEFDDFDDAMNKMSITPKVHRFRSEHMRMPSRIRPSTSPESL